MVRNDMQVSVQLSVQVVDTRKDTRVTHSRNSLQCNAATFGTACATLPKAEGTQRQMITWIQWNELLTTAELELLARQCGISDCMTAIPEDKAAMFERACEELRRQRHDARAWHQLN
jgi:hypothetical protein